MINYSFYLPIRPPLSFVAEDGGGDKRRGPRRSKDVSFQIGNRIPQMMAQ